MGMREAIQLQEVAVHPPNFFGVFRGWVRRVVFYPSARIPSPRLH